MPYKDPEKAKECKRRYYLERREETIKRNNEMKKFRNNVKKYQSEVKAVFDPDAVNKRNEFLRKKGILH